MTLAKGIAKQSNNATIITVTPAFDFVNFDLSAYPAPVHSNNSSNLLETTPTPITYSPYPPPNSPPIIQSTTVIQNPNFTYQIEIPVVYRPSLYNRDIP